MIGSALLPSIGLLLAPVQQPLPATAYASYSTPQQYVTKFGLAEAAQMLFDEERALTPELLGQALQRVSGGSWPADSTPAQQRAATAALGRLTRQLATVSSYMDGYLRSVVSLPIAAVDANASTLEDCCLALTRFELADDCDNSTVRIDEAAKLWRAWLKDVAAGKVQLVSTATGDAVPAVPGRVRVGRIKSGINWGAFG